MTNLELTLKIARDVLGLDAEINGDYVKYPNGLFADAGLSPLYSYIDLSDPSVIVQMIKLLIDKDEARPHLRIDLDLLDALGCEPMHEALAKLCVEVLES